MKKWNLNVDNMTNDLLTNHSSKPCKDHIAPVKKIKVNFTNQGGCDSLLSAIVSTLVSCIVALLNQVVYGSLRQIEVLNISILTSFNVWSIYCKHWCHLGGE